MSMLKNGKHVCDRCGEDVGNGGVMQCIVVSQLDPHNPGMVRNLHFCLDTVDESGTVTRKGCERKILSPANIKFNEENRE